MPRPRHLAPLAEVFVTVTDPSEVWCPPAEGTALTQQASRGEGRMEEEKCSLILSLGFTPSLKAEQ